jgi:hypothetical protein
MKKSVRSIMARATAAPYLTSMAEDVVTETVARRSGRAERRRLEETHR